MNKYNEVFLYLISLLIYREAPNFHDAVAENSRKHPKQTPYVD